MNILHDNRVSYKSKGVWWAMTKIENPTIANLMKYSSSGYGVIKRAVDELIKYGYLKREKVFGQVISCKYDLFEEVPNEVQENIRVVRPAE